MLALSPPSRNPNDGNQPSRAASARGLSAETAAGIDQPPSEPPPHRPYWVTRADAAYRPAPREQQTGKFVQAYDRSNWTRATRLANHGAYLDVRVSFLLYVYAAMAYAAAMDQDVIERNVARWRALARLVTDPAKRQKLEKLIDEAEERLVFDEIGSEVQRLVEG
jgi:hypothetical protein